MVLTQRKETILKAIVGDYIDVAVPVGSESIATKHGLQLSSATIRNVMADLEAEGYIIRPHSSAGGVPSDKGYRYYVESLGGGEALSLEERMMIRHQFHQVAREFEEWTHLSAALLAQIAHNLGVASLPRARHSRLKRLELIAIQELLTLMVIIFQGANIKRELLNLEETASQQELDYTADRLSESLDGLTYPQIQAKDWGDSPLEKQVVKELVRLMQWQDEGDYEELHVDGLRHIFGQPEFSSGERVRTLMEVLEDKSFLQRVLQQIYQSKGIQVVIGSEIRDDALQHCSLVITGYGFPGDIKGVIGIIGPKRMNYARSISAVRYLSSLMDEMITEVYG
ncbi:MAG: heat-inducible transcriptional repressor HrcA [Dehalococcoidia bacterium]